MTTSVSVLGTDLALEAAQAQLKTIRLTSRPGLTVRRRVRDGYALTAMDLTDSQQAEKLMRPMGKYITMELTPYLQRQQAPDALPGSWRRCCRKAMRRCWWWALATAP